MAQGEAPMVLALNSLVASEAGEKPTYGSKVHFLGMLRPIVHLAAMGTRERSVAPWSYVAGKRVTPETGLSIPLRRYAQLDNCPPT